MIITRACLASLLDCLLQQVVGGRSRVEGKTYPHLPFLRGFAAETFAPGKQYHQFHKLCGTCSQSVFALEGVRDSTRNMMKICEKTRETTDAIGHFKMT